MLVLVCVIRFSLMATVRKNSLANGCRMSCLSIQIDQISRIDVFAPGWDRLCQEEKNILKDSGKKGAKMTSVSIAHDFNFIVRNTNVRKI